MTRLHDNDIATMKLLQEELESLNARWKEARPYSQEVANLDASFKSWEKRLGRAVEAGLFQRILAAAAGVEAWPPGGQWEHDCPKSTSKVLLREGQTCTNCGAPAGVKGPDHG